jgi:hypothetical protein
VIPGLAAPLGIGVLGEDFGANPTLGLALIRGGSCLASGGTGPLVESRSDQRS